MRKVIFWLLHAVKGAGRSYCQKMISLSFYFCGLLLIFGFKQHCWFLFIVDAVAVVAQNTQIITF